MARFSLRNKKKLVEAFDVEYYNLLIESLKAYFGDEDLVIKEHKYEGLSQKIIHVPNVQPNTDSYFEFVVLRRRFDVYNLAYYSAAG
jgi:5-methylcytosine-specific restriction endonuclease McrBC regulatory subunit McrC